MRACEGPISPDMPRPLGELLSDLSELNLTVVTQITALGYWLGRQVKRVKHAAWCTCREDGFTPDASRGALLHEQVT